MNDGIIYIPIDLIDNIFEAIQSYLFDDKDPAVDYSKERIGKEKLIGILEQAHQEYYEDFFDKATFIFLSINKGHFFSNGNKRLAITFLKIFYTLNNYVVENKGNTSEPHGELIEKDLLTREFFVHDDQLALLYGLAMAVASERMSNVSFDVLKMRIRHLLTKWLHKVGEK